MNKKRWSISMEALLCRKSDIRDLNFVVRLPASGLRLLTSDFCKGVGI